MMPNDDPLFWLDSLTITDADMEQVRQYNAHLRQQHDRLVLIAQMAENVGDGLSFSDAPDAVFSYANRAYLQMTGRPDLVEARYTIFEVYVDGPAALGVAAQHTIEQGSWEGRLTIGRPDGSRVPVRVTVWLVPPADATQPARFAAVARDLSDHLALEQERQQVAAERIAMQEQIIAAQDHAIRELSTPLIPVADGVVVMPLIGAIDSRRLVLMRETLLAGVVAHHAHAAIIDITGVQVVDPHGANGLVRTAQAVEMLGAQVVLTGMRAEVAQILVALQVDLRGIRTLSSLQHGIAYASRLVANAGARHR